MFKLVLLWGLDESAGFIRGDDVVNLLFRHAVKVSLLLQLPDQIFVHVLRFRRSSGPGFAMGDYFFTFYLAGKISKLKGLRALFPPDRFGRSFLLLIERWFILHGIVIILLRREVFHFDECSLIARFHMGLQIF